MKIFNKVLAMVLAIFTVLAILPVSVLAEAWADVDVKNDGNSTKVTLTLDAGTLASILQKDGISPDLLKDLKNGVSVDVDALREAFSVAELFEIIPRDEWLKVFNIEEILQELDAATLMGYIDDVPGLLNGVMNDPAKAAKLETLLKSTAGIEDCIDALVLIQNGYLVSKVPGATQESLILNRISAENRKALIALIQQDPAKFDQLVSDLESKLTGFDLDGIKKLLDVDAILDGGVISIGSVVDANKVEAIINNPESGLKLSDVVDIEKVEALINNPTSGVKLSDIVDNAKVEALINDSTSGVALSSIVSFDSVKALISNGTIVAEDVVKLNVASAKLSALLDTNATLATEIAGCVDEDATIDYLNANVDPATLVGYVTMTGAVITAIDAVKLVQDEVLTVDDLLDNNLIDKAGVAEIAIDSISDIESIINTDAVKTYIDDEIILIDDVVDTDKVKALIDNETIAIDDVIDTENVKTLIDNETIAIDDVINTEKVKALVENDTLAIEDVIDLDAAKDALLALDNAVLMEYVDEIEAFRLIGLDKAVELVGGYAVAKNYIDINGLISDIDLVATIKKIPSAQLESVVDFGKLFGKVDIYKMVEIIGVDTLLAEIDKDEILDLVTRIDVKEKIVPVLRMIVDHILLNVDGIALNGFDVAAEDADGYLTINAGEIARVLKDLIPTLNEIATLKDNKVFSLTVDLDYTVDGTTTKKSKSVTFELVIDGDLSLLKNAAAKLQALINTYINKLEVSVDTIAIDINIPSVVTSIYATVLNYDNLSDDIKQKLMSVTDMNGNEAIAFLEETLTYGDLLAILESVDPSALLNTLTNISYVQTILNAADAKLGTSLSDMTIDDIVDIALNSDLSIENVCAKIEAKTGRDVLAIAESLAIKTDNLVNKAEKIAVVEKILNAVESKLGIDVSEISVAEILERAEDVDLLDAVVEKVSAKIGKDIRGVLNAYTIDELYAAAVEKAAEYEGQYNKVVNYVLTKLSLLPDRFLNASIADAYKGEGVFAAEKSFSYNPAAFAEKVLGKLLSKVNVPAVNSVIDLIMGRIPNATVTTEVSVALRFQNLYRITYRSRDDVNNEGAPLFTAIVPVGTDLNIFKNNSDLIGYEFTGWYTADGEQIATMPAADTTVYADLNSVKLTFVDTEGALIGSIMVPKGGKLNSEDGKYLALIAQIEAMLDQPEGNANIHRDFSTVWTWDGGKLDLSNEVGLDASFDQDTTLVAGWTPNYFLGFDNADIAYSVEEIDGAYRLIIHGGLPTAFKLNLDNAGMLYRATTDENISLTVYIEDGDFDFLVFSDATLASLYTAGANDVVFDYVQLGTMAPASFADTVYGKVNGVDFYAFDITADGAKKTFDAPIAITVPFAAAELNKVTHVYTMTDGARELMETEVVKNGLVKFDAVHFSDFVIANEYEIVVNFADEDGVVITTGSLKGETVGTRVYYPEGAEIELAFDGIDNYNIVDITYNGNSIMANAFFTMPGEDVVIDVTLEGARFYIYFFYNDNGTMKKVYEYGYQRGEIDVATFTLPTVPAAQMQSIAAAAPKGYSTDVSTITWTAIDKNDLGVKNIYVFAKWSAINYTVKFVDEKGAAIGSVLTNVTIEKYPTVDTLPLPAILEGMSKWTIKTIGTPNASNEVVITLTAVYFDVKYPVVAGENVTVDKTEASAGDEITVTVTDKTGYNETIVVTKPNGETVTVTNGKFTMPASAVTVTVVYTAKTYSYSINGTAGTGSYGDTITFTVTVENGYKLVSISDFCTLVSTVVDGSNKVLTYAFTLDGDKTVTYTLKEVGFSILNIFNGKLFTGSGDPASSDENVKFNGWSAALFGSIRFATFSVIEAAASLLWLWILLAILLLIAIIALLYVLHITGKWKKPMFLVRFVVWVVNLFFALCLAIAALGLKIAHLFGKSEDPADYGFTEVEKEETPAEELPAEETATEEAPAEETATEEAPAEETATEEAPAEETATEEAPAEETATEEAPAEETATEEAPAEETATEEAPAEETATEEAPAEETATEEATTEEKKDNE